jgi:hypothetical protein
VGGIPQKQKHPIAQQRACNLRQHPSIRKAVSKGDSRTVPPGTIRRPLVTRRRCIYNAGSRNTFHPVRAPNMNSEEAMEKYLAEYDSDTWASNSEGYQKLLEDCGDKLLPALQKCTQYPQSEVRAAVAPLIANQRPQTPDMIGAVSGVSCRGTSWERLWCLDDLGNSNALYGIDGNSKLRNTGDVLHDNEIRSNFYQLVSQHLGTALKEIEFVATIGFSQVHRLTGMENG